MPENNLYYGDNLPVLRDNVADESVDLIYLDPPFKSNQDYHILFKEQDESRAAEQMKAFEDTWQWDSEAVAAYRSALEQGGTAAQALRAMHELLGGGDMMAYLTMMTPRLAELRRVLKPTGTIYLHCDPAASHYLKVIMDAVFGSQHFLNEVVWKRTHAHGSAKRYGPVHDCILFYAKSGAYKWMNPRCRHDPDYVARHFKMRDKDGRLFQPITLTGSGIRRGDSGRPWRGVNPTDSRRHWAMPGAVISRLGITGNTVQEKLDALDAADRIFWPDKADGKPRLKWYADELEGAAPGDIWTDIDPISARAAERLGYPTQKPEALLDRIILAGTEEGDTVLDPFCGCGTAISSAQRLGRRWVGIDVTRLAITLTKRRLRDAFGRSIAKTYSIIGQDGSVCDR